jgi:hypothetical protein
MKFENKSVLGMLIVFPILMFGAAMVLEYGYEIGTVIDIISFILVIAIAVFSIFIAVAVFSEEKNYEVNINKNKIVIKLISKLILITTITFAILIKPEVREGIFYALRFVYFLLAVVLIPMYIKNEI